MKVQKEISYIMKLRRELMCWLGWHPEYDLWLAGSHQNMFVKTNKLEHRDWGRFKIKYNDFGEAYCVTCKHCGKPL